MKWQQAPRGYKTKEVKVKNNKRSRRYKFTRRQQNILKFWKIDENYIDEEIAGLTE
jgi:hypothetical protein